MPMLVLPKVQVPVILLLHPIVWPSKVLEPPRPYARILVAPSGDRVGGSSKGGYRRDYGKYHCRAPSCLSRPIVVLTFYPFG